MAFNWVDYILLGIFFISILGGLMRGGVREVMSLITWIAAFIIAGKFTKPLASAFAGSEASVNGDVSVFALGISFCALFFGTIIVGSLIGYFANRVVEGAGVSIFNRFLGGIFGFARGYLVNLLVVFIVQLTPTAQSKNWTDSVLANKFQPTAQWLGEKVQPGFESLKSKMGQTLEDITSGAQNSIMGVYQHQ